MNHVIEFFKLMIVPQIFITEDNIAKVFDKIKNRKITHYLLNQIGIAAAFVSWQTYDEILFFINCFLIYHHTVYLMKLHFVDQAFETCMKNLQVETKISGFCVTTDRDLMPEDWPSKVMIVINTNRKEMTYAN